MDTPGKILESERRKQKKSIREIARTLQINIDYLKAIEDDNYELIPAEVFTKGYLRLYAGALELEGDYILGLYKNQIKTNRPGNEPKSSQRVIILNYKPVVIILSFLLFVILTVVFTKGQKPVMEAIREVEETKIIKDEKNEKLSLRITATDLTWVSVSIDGSKRKEWLLRTGEEVTVRAFNEFAIKIGNAGGTRLTFNNEDLGILGPHGKVIDIVLNKNKNG